MTTRVKGSAASLTRKRVEASGLLPVHARRMQLKPTSVQQLKKLHAELPAYERAMVIPYFTPDGKPSGFWRARYLAQPRPEVNGNDPFAKHTAPPEWTADLRYVQPPGTLAEVYLPPLLKGTSWPRIMKDPSIPVCVTEGEMKAAKSCAEGIPCAGLGGVWMFKSGRMKHPLLPWFYSVEWKGRTVYLIYDSDASTNLDVHRAAAELAKHLTGLGAVPRVIFLPHVCKGDKTGLDDYLLEEGASALGVLLERSEPYAPAASLYELNGQVAYVKDPGIVVELNTGRKITPGAFKDHAYANVHFFEEKITKSSTQLVKQPAAAAWLKWERRFELERITFKPGQPRITREQEYNYWPGWGCEPRRGDVSLWRQLLDHLFRGAPRERRWFEQWLAYPIQHPGEKLFTACLLWGVDHGTGKSLVGYSVGKVYGKNFAEIKKKHLFSAHNEWAENKQFVLADEITSGRRDVIDMADALKNMITSRTIRLNPKYVPSYEVPDVLNYYFTSNHPDAMFLEDKDRRYFIWHVNAAPLPRSFYQAYDEWLWEKNGKQGGPSALFYHLLHLDLRDFDPQGPAPMTEAKIQMMEAGLSDVGAWVRKLRDQPDVVLKFGDAPLAGDLWTNEELLSLFDPERRKSVTANGLGRELTRAGIPQACHGKPVRLPEGHQTRLYAVRNPLEWAKAPQRMASRHYHETRGVPKEDGRKIKKEKKFQ